MTIVLPVGSTWTDWLLMSKLVPNRFRRARARSLIAQSRRLSVGVRRGLFDEFGRLSWVRYVGHMAGSQFDRRGMGALRHHPFLNRIDRPVLARHHVPDGFGLPCGIRDL